MFNVQFGDLKSYDDFGLIYNSKTISEPEPQYRLVSVPGRNGAIDLTEVLTGDVRYNTRTITMTFTITDLFPMWETVRTRIANALHGKYFKIIFDDDLGYYWSGRVTVGNITPVKSTATITLTATVEPYKHDTTPSDEPWLWDPFDFENGIINELYDITVSGTQDVTVIVSGESVNPVIISDAQMTVTFKGNTYNIGVGTQTVYDILLEEGENTLTFTGNGQITIDYVGGSL